MSNLDPQLLSAAESLEINRRDSRWCSVTLCVLDAVWSIGSRYASVVVPTVRAVASELDIESPVEDPAQQIGPDPVPLSAFLEHFPDPEALASVTNRQVTSTRSGILKADASLRYARVLIQNGIDTLAEANSALEDLSRVERIGRGFAEIPGEGVRSGYFWMLVGGEDLVKPDRHILNWLAQNGASVGVEDARVLLGELAAELSSRRGEPVTAWEVDHAIWTEMSSR